MTTYLVKIKADRTIGRVDPSREVRSKGDIRTKRTARDAQDIRERSETQSHKGSRDHDV